jgi:hypothetical protein
VDQPASAWPTARSNRSVLKGLARNWRTCVAADRAAI